MKVSDFNAGDEVKFASNYPSERARGMTAIVTGSCEWGVRVRIHGQDYDSTEFPEHLVIVKKHQEVNMFETTLKNISYDTGLEIMGNEVYIDADFNKSEVLKLRKLIHQLTVIADFWSN